MKKNKLFVVSISSLIILGVIGLSGNGFAYFPPPPPPPNGPTFEKWGVIFYSSDAGSEAGDVRYEALATAHVERYKTILLSKGYSDVLIFKDVESKTELDRAFYDPNSNNDINDLEDQLDAVFFYIWGHGGWSEIDSYSAVTLSPGGWFLTSSYFNDKLDELDTVKIGFLVDACYSGGFVLDFQDDPYLAMTSADTQHFCCADPITHENYFSCAFWYYALYRSNFAVDCWDWANFWHPGPNPQIYNGLSTYTFF